VTLLVAVDFGTSSTCTAVSVQGRAPQVVVVDGAPLLPSAVYLGGDGALFVGHEADRQAALDPSRFEPFPKRRIDEGQLLLGDAVIGVPDVISAVIGRAVTEARRLAAWAPADVLVLTHPADWGAARIEVLRRACRGLAGQLLLVPEPTAAALFYGAEVSGPVGAEPLAVLDLGGGTVDASVVRPEPGVPGRTGRRFQVLAARGDPSFGGADVDQLLLDWIGTRAGSADPAAWQRLTGGRELADRRRRRVLRADVCGAKETLSRHAYTDVPLPPPFPDAHVTRGDLEGLIAEPVRRCVRLLGATLDEAGVPARALGGVFLVGGSSRIPLVSRCVQEMLGVLPVLLDQPETVVARGALRTVLPATDADATLTAPHPVASRQPRPPYPPAAGIGTPPAFPASGPVPSAPPGAAAHAPASGPYRLPGVAATGPTPVPPIDHPTAVTDRTAPLMPPFGPGGFDPGSPSGPDPAPGSRVGGPTAPSGHPEPDGRRGSAARSRRAPLWIGIGLVVAAAVAVTLIVVLRQGSGPAAVPDRRITAYEYEFSVPGTWQQGDSDDAAKQIIVLPAGAAPDTELIQVDEFVLNFDSTVDRARAVSEVRTKYDARRAGTTPPPVDGFQPDAAVGSRQVVRFQEHRTNAAGAQVTADWYVLFSGRLEVTVGCQRGIAGSTTVEQACRQVVGSLIIHS
jgi:hypothetical protein